MTYMRVESVRRGGAEELRIVEAELPQAGPGEVRLKVLAAGVAWGDLLKRGGLGRNARLPFTPGYDVVGIVDQLGPGVGTVEVGATVAALPLSGGYAEYLCLPASSLVPVPLGLDPAEVVCLVMNYVVAYQLLHRAARVKAGERVLVHSAAGGVGTALLQLGRLAGVMLYGAASLRKHDLVADLGAIPVDYRAGHVVERVSTLTRGGVEVVIDPLGGTHLIESYRLLRRGGRLVAFGAHTALVSGWAVLVPTVVLPAIMNLIPDGRTVVSYGVTRPPHSSPAWCREDLVTLLGLLARGDIKPIIAERIPLEQARRAHELLESGAVTGKLVLVPGRSAVS